MKIAAFVILSLALSAVEGFAVTLDPYRVPETVDLAARGRILASTLKDPGSEGNVYLLADKVERLDKSLSETTMAIENVGLLVPYLSGTDYGPKEIVEHLLNFMDELKTETEQLAALKADAEAALAASQPGGRIVFAAQALKQRALGLRIHLEGLRNKAQVLAANVTANAAALGAPAVAASSEIADKQTTVLAVSGDGLLSAADQLVRKVQ